jgi:D-alanyl-D-alanine carboxypeptidase
MASLTKLMTALLIVENHELDEWVTVPDDIAQVDGNHVSLRAGDQFTVGDLLSALLIPSANDAAVTLAQYHSGSVETFVTEMNDRARQLGLHDTQYANPSGMDHLNQYSTPQDVAWLARFVLGKPEIAQRMATAGASIRSRQGREITLFHTHAFLHQAGSPVVAGKTGTTVGAGECLVSVVDDGQRQYLVVVLRSADRFEDLRRILRALDLSA